MPPPAVSVIKVEDQPVGVYKEFVARTEAVKTVELRARVEGFLVKRDFIEGQIVDKGQLLFEIDQRPFFADLNKARADLASARAELDNARKTLVRNRDLFQKGHISQADLDNQTSNEARAKAAVQAAQATVETARLNLSYTEIKAPFKGHIGRAQYSVGNLVGLSSQPLATLTSIDPFYVSFQVDEKTVVTHVQPGGSDLSEENKQYDMHIRLPNGALYKYEGKLNFADTRVDETTGTLTLRAEFPDPDRVIVPGLYVTMILESRDKKELPVIPQSSVQENQSGRFVLSLDKDNKVQTRQVELGRRIGPMWVVESGLKVGETIIVEGLQKVRAGVQVSPTLVKINGETGTIEAIPAKSVQQGQ